MSTPFPSAQAFEEMFEHSRRIRDELERQFRHAEERHSGDLQFKRRTQWVPIILGRPLSLRLPPDCEPNCPFCTCHCCCWSYWSHHRDDTPSLRSLRHSFHSAHTAHDALLAAIRRIAAENPTADETLLAAIERKYGKNP
jgi:hypothetical protein